LLAIDRLSEVKHEGTKVTKTHEVGEELPPVHGWSTPDLPAPVRARLGLPIDFKTALAERGLRRVLDT